MLSFLFVGNAVAQDKEKVRDSTSTTFSFSDMSLPNPESIEEKYQYDPSTDRYIYREKVGEVNITYPLILTPEEFQDLVLKDQMKKYFKDKVDALDGKKEGSKEAQRDLLPNFYVDSDFFESIFGGREIEIVPQGSVEIDLGGLYTKQDNPAISPRNRSNFTFDFDQRISLSLLGKIGTRLQITANYDTEATFAFQEQFKLEYTPTEDDIIKSLELGNVSLPLNSALIQGAQSLFGVKAQLQFGKTTITGVYATQQSESRSVNIEGGGSIEKFEIFASDYDENRHFFLAHYFRDTYDKSLERYPFINSNVQVNRIQVWVTSRSNNTQTISDARNVVGIQDLGESDPDNIGIFNGGAIPAGFINQVVPGAYPDNKNNDLNPLAIGKGGVLTNAIRDISNVQQGFGSLSAGVNSAEEGLDYVRLENARQLNSNEYTYHEQLGYVSLNQRLNNDEVLAVAFQYTVGGRVFQVGEFANDGIDSSQSAGSGTAPAAGNQDEVPANQNIIVKTLKSTITDVDQPIWDLMMKNIYNLGAFRLEQDDFRFNIFYTNPTPVNFIDQGAATITQPAIALPQDVSETTLLRVFNMDRLNANNDPVVSVNERSGSSKREAGDGFFDYVPGLTVDTENGRIIFTSAEPFGEYLFGKLGSASATENYESETTYNANQAKYVFRDLYTTTKIQAQQNAQEKDKFQLKGRYKNSGQDGISIGAFNVPRGSVSVTAGGRVLQEGVDYTVNYQLGRVNIIDEALKASNTPIQVSTENNAVFGQQVKRYSGINIEHKFTDDLLVGGTLINLNERPLTQKSNLNFEPINNTIVGLNASYSTEVPFLTRMVNKLPNIETEAPSNFSIRGEFAYLLAGSPKRADFDGKITSYIDDFEAAQASIDVSGALAWQLSSIPLRFGRSNENGTPIIGSGGVPVNDITSGYRRSKLSWYTIDPIFYTNRRPDGVTDESISDYKTRRVFVNEIFPQTDIQQGQTLALSTLDMVYDPGERGPYNYNPQAADNKTFSNPEENFGGITRQLTTTNFEQSNIEFIEFWMMDPFIYPENSGNEGGKIVFHLGNISEDVFPDGKKQYENGLPEEANSDLDATITAINSRVPRNQSLVYAFSTEGQQRLNQDTGYDGLVDSREATIPGNGLNFGPDPSADNYEYYLARSGSDIVDRYSLYNGVDGNSPSEVTNENRGNTTIPTAEDVNGDNTMNTIDNYYVYEIDIKRDLTTNDPYVNDVKDIEISLRNGDLLRTRWIQFKIPIYEPLAPAIRSDGGANPPDFRSIRFMRMLMAGFSQKTVMRMGTLDLVRGDYRRYVKEDADGINEENIEGTEFIVSTISKENNSGYTEPPGVFREELQNNNSIIREDEASLDLTVLDLEPNDARAVFKNFNIDMRQYENFEMFLHAEKAAEAVEDLDDNDLVAIVRMGNDFTENFYQIEIPLKASPETGSSPQNNTTVWPEENRVNVPLSLLKKIKSGLINASGAVRQGLGLIWFDKDGNEIPVADDRLGPVGSDAFRVAIKGNPSVGNVRVMMLGVKNNSTGVKSGRVWFNEMRMSDLKNQGGWAAVANMDANFADFASISATGRHSTIGFGGIEQGPNERSREDISQYDMVTNMNIGQLLPKKWGIQIPVNYSRGEELITPQFDPLNEDLELQDVLDLASDPVTRDAIEERSTEYTRRQSVSVIGLRKERTGAGERKPKPYDVENFTFSSTYNQTDHRDFEIEESLDQSVNLGATYDFNFQPLSIEPLKNVKFLDKSKYFQLLKDFNFNLLPTSFTTNANFNRQYNEQTFRDIDIEGGSNIGLDPLYQRNFLFDWQYGITYDLTKSFNLNFTSSNNRIVRNYIDEDNVTDNTIGIWDNFLNFGTPNLHNQSLQANYELPFSKIPVLKFLKATYSYSADFQWQKGSEALKTLEGIPDLGNTVQNSNVHRVSGNVDMDKLYKYAGLVKKKNNGKRIKKKNKSKDTAAQGPKIAPRTKKANTKISKTLSPANKTYNTFIGVLTAVKKVNLNYQQDNGIFLPGYTPDIGFIGTLRPTTGFTFGSQAEVRDLAARNGWLTLYQDFNQQYTEVEGRQLDMQVTVNLLPDLKIDISANRNYSETYAENFRVRPLDFEYESLAPNTFGNFSVSSLLIKTAFDSRDVNSSATFDKFKANRIVIAKRLAAQDPNSNGTNDEGFPAGYGSENQAVLLPAFLAAYSGVDANSISTNAFKETPLPNWDVKYTGLMKVKWFKKKFKRFSVAHGYRSTYTINQFQTNLEFDAKDRSLTDQNGNFRNDLLFSNVNLIEQFSPLFKIDMETKGAIKVSAEMKKDRALSFSFDNNLLTEIFGNEYIIGLGYRLKDLTLPLRVGGKRRMIKSDLNFKMDLSLRENQTVIRYIDLDNSEVTAGQSIYGLNFTVDYSLSKNLTALFFYDHTFSTFAISTAFPQTTIRGGFTLRYNFGN